MIYLAHSIRFSPPVRQGFPPFGAASLSVRPPELLSRHKAAHVQDVRVSRLRLRSLKTGRDWRVVAAKKARV